VKPTNEQLVARFQAGDEDAMAELLEQNKGLACRVIFVFATWRNKSAWKI